MKLIVFSCLILSLIIGSLTGWRRGLSENSRRQTLAGMTGTAGGMGAVEASAPQTGEEWRRAVASIPGRLSPYRTTHMARLRQTAHGLPMEALKSLLTEGWAETAGDDGTAAISLSVPVDEMIKRDAAQACEFLIQNHRNNIPFTEMLTAWGRQNPLAALAWVEAYPEYGQNQIHGQNQRAVLNGWAEHDPAAAFAAIAAFPDSSEYSNPFFFTYWAKSDPEAAVAAWATHQEKAFCRGALWFQAFDQCGPAGRDRLLEAFQRIDDPAVRAAGIAHFASWLATEKPGEAILLIRDPRLTEPQRQEMRMKVMSVWHHHDSAKAADWFWGSAPPDRKTETMEALIQRWNGGEGQSAACMEWIQRQPPESLPPETPQLLVESLFRFYPEIALKSWLKLAENRQDRADAAAALSKYLVGTPQGTRLPSLLREAGFDPELTRQVLEAGRLESP